MDSYFVRLNSKEICLYCEFNMSLLLKVLSFKGQPLLEPKLVEFSTQGGTIGRSERCTLQLPDPEKFVSRHHASIKFDFGNYYLTDCSLSGVFINKQKSPLHNQSQQLCNGMLLKIGEYQVEVAIDDQIVLGRENLGFAEALSLITHKPSSQPTEKPNSRVLINTDIPGATQLLNVFLQGVGLSGQDIQGLQPIETMQKIGQMFRAMVKGTVAVLRNRAELKSYFHANMTLIKPTTNNPLKAVIPTEEVLRQLLGVETGQLDSVEAIEQGFNDIIDHQLAMQAGIQASLNQLLETFNPESIEKQFINSLVLQKKAKCWHRYKANYQEAATEAMDKFYGDAFIEAYEKQRKVLLSIREKT